MDVLHITHQFAPETCGGVEAYVMDVGSEQAARGLDVQVLTGSHEGWPEPGIEELRAGPLRVHRLHRDDLFFDYHAKTWHPGAGEMIADFIARHRPRVVHVHQWIRMTSNLVEIVRSLGIPVVVTLHDYFTSCPRAFRLRLDGSPCKERLDPANCSECVPCYGHESRAELDEGILIFRDQCRAELEMADAVLVGMSTTADLLASTTDVPRERFETLPLGFDPRFPGREPLPAPLPDETLRFAFWGGVARHKGIAVMVSAFADLHRAGTPRPTELHVLGGFATPEFEAEVRALSEGLPIHFHGRFEREELRTVAPHVGIFPSTCLETHGLVLDECFEMGLPSIVTGHGVLAERAGGAALHVRPGDEADLTAAMRRFFDEPHLWHELQAALPPPSPSLQEHCDRLQTIYDRVAARSGALDGARPFPVRRHIAFLLRQRESALALLTPKNTK